jgi:DNA primase
LIQNDDRQRVLDATDIVRLVGDHLTLRAKGREYIGLCPFHDDHTPSMYVVPAKQIYHCFSCGASGNAIGFVMNYHKMSFREALEHLADRAGIKLTPWRRRPMDRAGEEDDEERTRARRAALLSASAVACGFYRAILNHPEHGCQARELVQRRGLTPEMLELFQIGAAPDRWDGLAVTVGAKQFDLTPYFEAGLLKPREAGAGCYDALRNRLIFPIHDQIGRVIGFGGRRINDEDEPKYINSPESPLFDKSTTLYGLHQAAQEVRRSRVALVTEGYMDAIACHQAGFRNAVATLGTALTAGNARALRRLCDEVILLFDGDEAGQKAADRAVEVFFAVPIDLRIAVLSSHTDAKDPDELLKREGGAEALRGVIAAAVDPLTLLFRRIRSSLEGQGLSAQSRIVEEFLSRLVDLGLRPVDRDMRYQLIVRRLAAITGTEWGSIASTISQRAARRAARPGAEAPIVTRRPLNPLEHLLGCILCRPELLRRLDHPLRELAGREGTGSLAQVLGAMEELVIHESDPDLRAVLAMLEDPESQQLATRMATEVERLTEGRAERIELHWNERLAVLTRERIAARSLGDSGEDGGSWESAEPELSSLQRIVRARAGGGSDLRLVPKPASG